MTCGIGAFEGKSLGIRRKKNTNTTNHWKFLVNRPDRLELDVATAIPQTFLYGHGGPQRTWSQSQEHSTLHSDSGQGPKGSHRRPPTRLLFPILLSSVGGKGGSPISFSTKDKAYILPDIFRAQSGLPHCRNLHIHCRGGFHISTHTALITCWHSLK